MIALTACAAAAFLLEWRRATRNTQSDRARIVVLGAVERFRLRQSSSSTFGMTTRTPPGTAASSLWPYRALLAAAIAAPLLLFALVAWLDRGAVLREAEREAEETVGIFHQHALNVFETHQVIAAWVSEHIRGMSWDEIAGSAALHRYLAKIENDYLHVQALWLIDPAGRVRNASRMFPAPSVSVADRDYFSALRQGNTSTFVGHLNPHSALGDVHFTLVRRHDDGSGAFSGLIAVTVSPGYFGEFWRPLAEGRDTTVGLVRADGMILAREPSLDHEATSVPTATALGQAIRQGERGSLRTVSALDGIERLYAFRKVGNYDAYVVYGVGVDAVLKQWREHLLSYGSFLALVAAGLILTASAALRHARREHAALEQWRQTAGDLAEEMARRASAEDQLRQAQKMEILGQLTGGLAHDFRNLLNVIIGNLELVQRRANPARAAARIANALEAAARGEKAIQSLLAFARRQSLSIEVFDLDAALARMEPLLKQALGTRVMLALLPNAGGWPVAADITQMELAVLNMAVNARDAMPKGGTLRITTENVSLVGEPNGLRGDFVALRVSDTGVGIRPELLARVFEPFFTTKERGKGSGLGLSQVYGFALQCRGTVAIESEPGRGTMVTLYLPRGDPSATGAAAQE